MREKERGGGIEGERGRERENIFKGMTGALAPCYLVYYKHITIINDALELSVSDTTIWRVTLESSITILEASFSLIYDVYSTGITCN